MKSGLPQRRTEAPRYSGTVALRYRVSEVPFRYYEGRNEVLGTETKGNRGVTWRRGKVAV